MRLERSPPLQATLAKAQGGYKIGEVGETQGISYLHGFLRICAQAGQIPVPQGSPSRRP
jgi:hypothetical protein